MVAALAGGTPASADNLAFSLLERYLDSLREQAGIPGISVAVVQNGVLAWDHGLGRQNVDANAAATAETPYPIADLSQVFASTVLLKKCVDESYLEVTDSVVRWIPTYDDAATTVGHLLSHSSSSGSFKYDLSRYASLTDVVRQCGHGAYARLLVSDVFERLGMASSVPGETLGSATASDREVFGNAELDRYATILRQNALPYRVDSRGRATRADYSPRRLDASSGIVSTVRDLARFDIALSTGVLVDRATLQRAWTRASSSVPTGLGWFVQVYNGEPLVWQFGLARDAYSSLILKIPNRDITLILLANSDGLSAPYALENGDVTASVFARTFLRFIGL